MAAEAMAAAGITVVGAAAAMAAVGMAAVGMAAAILVDGMAAPDGAAAAAGGVDVGGAMASVRAGAGIPILVAGCGYAINSITLAEIQRACDRKLDTHREVRRGQG
jgi:hypothetical protein